MSKLLQIFTCVLKAAEATAIIRLAPLTSYQSLNAVVKLRTPAARHSTSLNLKLYSKIPWRPGVLREKVRVAKELDYLKISSQMAGNFK